MSIVVEFDPQTEAQLFAAAQCQGIDAPEVIRKLIREYLPPVANESRPNGGENRTLGEIITEIGFVTGGPTDVARNPRKYMQGFGEPKSTGS